MRKIKFTGYWFRKMYIGNEGVCNEDIVAHTPLSRSQVSKEIKSLPGLNDKHRIIIYDYLKSTIYRMIPYNEFWCVSKVWGD